MVSVNGTSIKMTRGDTFRAYIGINDANGDIYIPSVSDKVVFTAKERYTSKTPVIEKDVPIDTLLLELTPNDTKGLNMPYTYVYDIQLIKADGTVDTFIAKASLIIEEEVG